MTIIFIFHSAFLADVSGLCSFFENRPTIRLQLDALQFRVINRQQLSYPLGSASVDSTVLTEWPLQGLTRRDSKEIARRYGKLIERMYRPD